MQLNTGTTCIVYLIALNLNIHEFNEIRYLRKEARKQTENVQWYIIRPTNIFFIHFVLSCEGPCGNGIDMEIYVL